MEEEKMKKKNIEKDEENKRKKDNKNEKKVIIYLIIIAIILIYFALFFIHYIVDKGKIKDTISTEIQYPDNTVQGEHDDKPGQGDNQNNIVDNSDRFKVVQPTKDENGNIIDKEWNELKELDIFKNSYFHDESIIAPGVKGSYNFTVENESENDFNYNVTFTEENKYNINMVYKLKVNGEYVVGDANNWVKYDQLNRAEILLKARNIDLYTIEWKWEDAENDTQIGQTEGAYYKMFIKVVATQITE